MSEIVGAIVKLTQAYAERLSDAKWQEAYDRANPDVEQSENTARALGVLDGIAIAIETLSGRKFKFVDPPLTMNGTRLIAVNLLGEALYVGYIGGFVNHYILRPGSKLLSDEYVDLDKGWVFLDPNRR